MAAISMVIQISKYKYLELNVIKFKNDPPPIAECAKPTSPASIVSFKEPLDFGDYALIGLILFFRDLLALLLDQNLLGALLQ